jgi:multidrug efflux system outer membrane protein
LSGRSNLQNSDVHAICAFASWAELVRFMSILILTAAGCTVGPKYTRPAIAQPANFKSQPSPDAAPLIAPEWWLLYSDSVLDQLIASAHASNQSIQQSVAAVDQARAVARIARSYLYPSLSFNPAFVRELYSGNRRSTFTDQTVPGPVTLNDWLAPIDLTYELDIWGRIRRSLEVAKAQEGATADQLALVRLTIETDVAQFYFTLRSLDAQSVILTQTVAAYGEQVRLLSSQLNSGLVSPIVLRQAQAQLEATVAQQQDIVRARADEEHALSILCGQPAASFAVASNPLYEASPPAVPPGLPAQLLVRRPDVAAAEQNVVAANAQIGVAKAQLYPTFTLTSFAGFESNDISSLSNWRSAVAAVAPAVSAPIFEGGRLKANVKAAEAAYRETVAAYINQVFVAYGDVEDALSDLHAFSDEVLSLREAVTASESYLQLANSQYRSGLVDYLTVIDAERTLLANQLTLVQTVNLHVGASIHLIKALGGGWEKQP